MQPVVEAREKGVRCFGLVLLKGSRRVGAEDERAGMDIRASIAAIALAMPFPPCFLWRRRIWVASSKSDSMCGLGCRHVGAIGLVVGRVGSRIPDHRMLD